MGSWIYNPIYKDYGSIYNWFLGPPCKLMLTILKMLAAASNSEKQDVKAGHPVGEKPYFLFKGSASQLMHPRKTNMTIENQPFEPGTLNTQF